MRVFRGAQPLLEGDSGEAGGDPEHVVGISESGAVGHRGLVPGDGFLAVAWGCVVLGEESDDGALLPPL